MAIIFILLSIFLIILLVVLFCCLHISTPYDRQVDDMQQIEFLKSRF